MVVTALCVTFGAAANSASAAPKAGAADPTVSVCDTDDSSGSAAAAPQTDAPNTTGSVRVAGLSTNSAVTAGQDFSEEIPDDGELVPVEQYLPGIYVELKYATADNITGQVIYDFDVPFLRYSTVKKLAETQKTVEEAGYSLKIWDAFRPTAAQYTLWDAMPDGRYIANPYQGYSNHSRGNCVDVTLVAADGTEIPMPTGFDDFTAMADRDYSDVSGEALANVQLLEQAMEAAGFIPYTAEWWHFTDETDYTVIEDFQPSDELQAIQVSAVGDNILANGYGFGYAGTFEEYMDRAGGNLSYFFEAVQDVLATDDLTIANSENVFTTQTERVNKDSQGNRAFWFRSDPASAGIYAAGSVEAVNTANNHSHDYGEAGYQESLQALAQAGVTTFGYGQAGRYEVGQTVFALLGFNALGPLEEGVGMADMKAQVRTEIAAARRWADVVVVYFHWGEEMAVTANSDQTELAHFAVDCGANLVLGSHPHVLQTVETYHGAVIAYSLGNFVYGGAQTPDRNTMILSLKVYVDRETGRFRFLRHTEIPVYVYTGSRNQYQPVLKAAWDEAS